MTSNVCDLDADAVYCVGVAQGTLNAGPHGILAVVRRTEHYYVHCVRTTYKLIARCRHSDRPTRDACGGSCKSFVSRRGHSRNQYVVPRTLLLIWLVWVYCL